MLERIHKDELARRLAKRMDSDQATLAHEITHWPRYPTHFARDFGHNCFGNEGYVIEELVAQIESAFLCDDQGATPQPREDAA